MTISTSNDVSWRNIGWLLITLGPVLFLAMTWRVL